MRMKLTAAGLILGAMSIGASSAWGQSYPNKPIRIIVSEAGGGTDFAARLIQPGFSEALGQPVVVDNRAGALISTEVAARASPDGYSLILAGSPLWILPLFQKVSYDTFRD